VTITEQDNHEEDRFIYNEKKTKTDELKERMQKLSEEKENLEHSLNQIQQNEQLFKLQCDLGKFDPKILIKEIIAEQNKRVSNIRGMKIRYVSLNQFREKSNKN
jgi:hypothetical protein